MNASQ